MTRLRLRSLLLLAPVFIACGSGGGAGPGGGGSGGSGGAAGGSTGAAGGTAGTSGSAGGGAAGSAGSGGAAGSAGSGGAAGSAGSGGAVAGAGGAGGMAGAGGTGGAAGSAGSGGSGAARGGSGGGAGSGGATGAAGTGGSGGTTSSSLHLEYQNSSTTTTSFSVRLTNAGPAMPLISTIKVRYYFRDDTANRDATPLVTAASWKIAGSSTPIDLRMAPGCSTVAGFATPPQSSYVDFGCGLTSPMNAQDVITFTLTIDPSTQLASNDYSYADTAGAFAPNDHLLLLLNGLTVAGTAP